MGCCKVSAADLRHPVTIQEAVETRGAGGSVVKTWSQFKKAWAAVEELSGAERIVAQQTDNTVNTRLIMRRLDIAGATPQMRLLFDGRTLNIVSITNSNDPRREFVTVECREDV